MSSGSKVLTAIVFVVVLIALGGADAFLTQKNMIFPTAVEATSSVMASSRSSAPGIARAPMTGSGQAVTGSGAASPSVQVAKQEGPDVLEVLNTQGIASETTTEESLLQRVMPPGATVQSRVLLKDNDRVAFFAWVESPEVKDYFTALKEALESSFSSAMRDLLDETQNPDGKPSRNVLSFYDPAIHEDRLLFVRVRERLYEFHVAPGKEPIVNDMMEALTQ